MIVTIQEIAIHFFNNMFIKYLIFSFSVFIHNMLFHNDHINLKYNSGQLLSPFIPRPLVKRHQVEHLAHSGA